MSVHVGVEVNREGGGVRRHTEFIDSKAFRNAERYDVRVKNNVINPQRIFVSFGNLR